MEKKDILAELSRHESQGTILSFPNRGPWGNSGYRGNWSGWIPAYFCVMFDAKAISEIFAGSGTTSDVAMDLGIPYCGIDLNPNPPRKDIYTMDILDYNMDLPDAFRMADIQFLHPPYPGINGIRYAGSQYVCDPLTKSRDIQAMPYSEGMLAVNKAVMRGYTAMKPGSYQVIMVGEVRNRGEYHSMIRDLAIPGQFHQMFVKQQHNTWSGRNSQAVRKNFAWTAFEVIAVTKKPSGYEIAFTIPQTFRQDIRESRMATWKDIIMATAHEFHNEFTVGEMYEAVQDCAKAKGNHFVRDKVRQTLNFLTASGLLHKTDDRFCVA